MPFVMPSEPLAAEFCGDRVARKGDEIPAVATRFARPLQPCRVSFNAHGLG